MPVPDFVQPWFGSSAQAGFLFYGGSAVLLVVFLLGGWLLFGRGPRRRRAFTRAQHLLGQGNWQEPLQIVADLQYQSRTSPRWQRRLKQLEGECHHAAGLDLLKEKDYEKSLERLVKAAGILDLDEAELRRQVIEAMLGEVRRLFASQPAAPSPLPLSPAAGERGRGEGAAGAGIHKLISRVLLLMPACPEAYFWQGLCHIREGQTDLALGSLRQAHRRVPENRSERGEGETINQKEGETRGASAYLDPPLYLGALLLREGRPEEALRFLAEANRLDANCPFITWQLGTAMMTSGLDTSIAVRALQRALGPRGLQQWLASPQKVWVEGFSEKRSFVRRLASRHPFSCPLFGDNVALMIRQGQITLGQGLYRLGNFEESAKMFNQLLQEGVPSLPVLRGLGLALARLDRFDQAFKHLRAAHELEDPKNYLTAGYLALCGAKGKPTQPEDKARNVHWAIRLVAKFDVKRNPEWANLLNLLFGEARSVGLPIAVDDQLRLCEALVSVEATDSLAADAYAHLAATLLRDSVRAGASNVSLLDVAPPMRPEYAWLFCRAAQQHGCTAEHDLDLFALTFATEAEARNFFSQRQWEFDDVEHIYLERWAARQPGAFPAALGPAYPARGESFLLSRSQWLEGVSDQAGALQCAAILVQLAPRNPRAYDRLAYLSYHGGDLERATALLEQWHRLAPADPLPLLRQAVIEQQRGQPVQRANAIERALKLCRGQARAEIAFLGARLALQEWGNQQGMEPGLENRNGQSPPAAALFPADLGKQALALLNECLHADAEHEAGLWYKAALCSILDQPQELVALAPQMGRLEMESDQRDARFYFLAAVCHLAAGEYARALAVAGKAEAINPSLAVDCAYLKGWAVYRLHDGPSASRILQQPATDATSPSQAHAQALLGMIAFEQGAYGEAIGWWKLLDAGKRKEWGLDEVLPSTIFVGALQSLQHHRFAEAADRIREAGRLGLRDRRLGPLLTLALIKAGQRLLYGNQ